MKAYQPIVDEMQTRLGLMVPAEYESDKVEDSIAVIARDKAQRIQAAKDKVVEHAVGLCMGVDWNNGTAAKLHRIKLENAVKELRKVKG